MEQVDEENKEDNNLILPTDITVPEEFSLDFPQLGDISDEVMTDNSENVFPTIPVDEDLFQEVAPFTELPLFTDKVDSSIFDDNEEKKMVIDFSDNNQSVFDESKKKIINFSDNNQNVFQEAEPADLTMSDAFWVTKEDNNDEDKVISFDEQVKVKRREPAA